MRSGEIRTSPARLPFPGRIGTSPVLSGRIRTRTGRFAILGRDSDTASVLGRDSDGTGPSNVQMPPEGGQHVRMPPENSWSVRMSPGAEEQRRMPPSNAVSDWVRQFNPAQLSPCHIPRYERSASSVALPSRRPTWYTRSRIAGSFTESGVLTDSLGRITNTLPSRSNRASSSSCAL